MGKIDKLLRIASERYSETKPEWDFSKLTTEELKEIIRKDTTEERVMEILEPVRLR